MTKKIPHLFGSVGFFLYLCSGFYGKASHMTIFRKWNMESKAAPALSSQRCSLFNNLTMVESLRSLFVFFVAGVFIDVTLADTDYQLQDAEDKTPEALLSFLIHDWVRFSRATHIPYQSNGAAETRNMDEVRSGVPERNGRSLQKKVPLFCYLETTKMKKVSDFLARFKNYS